MKWKSIITTHELNCGLTAVSNMDIILYILYKHMYILNLYGTLKLRTS